MIRIAIAGLAFTAITGCMTDAADEPEPETASVESASTIMPTLGTWIYTELLPISTNCSFTVTGENGPFTVDAATTTSLHVIPNDGGGPFSCSLSAVALGTQFNCPNRGTFTVDKRPTNDAVFTIKVSATGLLDTTRSARGKQDVAVSCVGTQCYLFGSLPCGFVDNFTATKQ